jgi:hypothetical protein
LNPFWELIVPNLKIIKFLYLETIITFTTVNPVQQFHTEFLSDANHFMEGLDGKTVRKILYNIDLAEKGNNARLFKKLRDGIWEFRIHYFGNQIRFLAFWDKSGGNTALVLATHGFIKKVDRVPGNEIERAINIREKYYNEKNSGIWRNP